MPHPGSSPNFSCISPPTLPMSGTDPAAAMAAMTASQGGYYDMYGGGGGGGSFGAKGSSFYPWMKNYSGKTREVFFCNYHARLSSHNNPLYFRLNKKERRAIKKFFPLHTHALALSPFNSLLHVHTYTLFLSLSFFITMFSASQQV